MGVANKVINILVLVVAIAAVALGFLLFQKREQLSESNKKMAEAIAANAKKMDSAAAISADSMSPAKSVEEVEQVLSKFNTVTKDAAGQRDEMAKQLANSAREVGLVPEGKKISYNDVIVNKYKPADIAGMVASKAKRERQFVKGIKQLGDILEDPVADEIIENDDTLIRIYEEFISDFSLCVDQVKEYLKLIETLMTEMNIPVQKMDGEDYAVGLAKNKAAAIAFLEEAVATMKKVNEIEKELANYKNNLANGSPDVVQAFTKLKKVEQERDVLKAENLRLRKIIDPTGSGEGLMSKERAVADFPFLRKITGKVTYVNKDLGFVILNIGEQVTIKVEEDGQLKDILADLPADGIMSCAANLDKPESVAYTGRIQINSIRNGQTIANILPSNGQIPNVGDSVVFTENDLEEMRKIREAKQAKIAAERANALYVDEQANEEEGKDEGILVEDEEEE